MNVLSGKENQRATFSRWSISINLKIMALMCYLDDDHRERYRTSFVMFGVEQEVKELFKEALSYDKSLLIRAYEEPIYERFLFWKYKTNEDKTMYRNLTLNEAKIAQTIPNSYDISIVPEGKAFHMIGNGWTVEVIKHIFKNIK